MTTVEFFNDGEPEMRNRIEVQKKKLVEMYDELQELKRNPKVNDRKIKVLGRQITRQNYHIGNTISELNKFLEEQK